MCGYVFISNYISQTDDDEIDLVRFNQETVFHRDLQTPRRELKLRRAGRGVFLTKFEASG